VAEAFPGTIDLDQVETNMVFVDTEAVGLPMLDTLERLKDLGVGATHTAGKVRMVTHLDIDDDDVELVLDGWRSLAKDR
jgi:threonine aldolase